MFLQIKRNNNGNSPYTFFVFCLTLTANLYELLAQKAYILKTGLPSKMMPFFECLLKLKKTVFIDLTRFQSALKF